MRSGYEYQVRDNLHDRHIDFEYEAEVLEYTSRVRGGCCEVCGSKKVGKDRKYTPDFIITRADYSKLYVEAKGRFLSTDRSKMRDVQRAHPDKDIRMLFQKRAKSQMPALIKWCDKYGFDYAFGTEVPDAWL